MRVSLVSTSLCFLVSMMGCGPSPLAPPPLQSWLTAEKEELTVELLALAAPAVGQNRVFYRLTRAGEPVTRAQLVQQPLMKMMTKAHACPVQNPKEEANPEGLFEGLLVFNMASTEQESWQLSLEITLEGQGPVVVELGSLTVADSMAKKALTRGNQKVTLTLGFAEPPQVGANPVVVTAHVPQDSGMMAYLPVEDLRFKLTPEMPSMGHGSSGNVDPSWSSEEGLYRGTVVFSMAGDWVLHLEVRSNEDAVLATYDFSYEL